MLLKLIRSTWVHVGNALIVGSSLQLNACQAERAQASFPVHLHVLPGDLLQVIVQPVVGVQPLIDHSVRSLQEAPCMHHSRYSMLC